MLQDELSESPAKLSGAQPGIAKCFCMNYSTLPARHQHAPKQWKQSRNCDAGFRKFPGQLPRVAPNLSCIFSKDQFVQLATKTADQPVFIRNVRPAINEVLY